jgi:deazaflavin-dependent oxidoreductase (nitroreductase family)
MSTFKARLWRGANSAAVWVYRRSGGKLGGKAKGGSPVLLLTVAGRSSGALHTTPVAYVRREGAYYVAAAANGSPSEPQWIRNLRKASTATIEIGRESHPVAVEVLEGAERDAAWTDIIVAALPFFADYETKSGRTIAVARLTPTG